MGCGRSVEPVLKRYIKTITPLRGEFVFTIHKKSPQPRPQKAPEQPDLVNHQDTN